MMNKMEQAVAILNEWRTLAAARIPTPAQREQQTDLAKQYEALRVNVLVTSACGEYSWKVCELHPWRGTLGVVTLTGLAMNILHDDANNARA